MYIERAVELTPSEPDAAEREFRQALTVDATSNEALTGLVRLLREQARGRDARLAENELQEGLGRPGAVQHLQGSQGERCKTCIVVACSGALGAAHAVAGDSRTGRQALSGAVEGRMRTNLAGHLRKEGTHKARGGVHMFRTRCRPIVHFLLQQIHKGPILFF